MIKKKILFVMYDDKIGGVYTSLLNLLSSPSIIDDFDVSLLIFNRTRLDECIKGVNYISSNVFLKILGSAQRDLKKNFFLYILRLILSGFSKIFSSYLPRALIFSTFKGLKRKQFDIAISYTHDMGYKAFGKGCNDFVLRKVKAKRKISFIHCDFEHFAGNNDTNRSIYKKFDRIACVSDSCNQLIQQMIPDVSSKIFTCHNIINPDSIKEKANECPTSQAVSNKINFISLCRLSGEKRVDRLIESFYKIKEEGFTNFHFYIVGDGPDKEMLSALSKKFGLEEYITFTGALLNPYPILSRSDYLLLASEHECAPMVFYEALCLGVGIMTTNTLSAHEMLDEFPNCMVVENDSSSILDGLKKLISQIRLPIVNKPELTCFFNKDKKTLEEFYELIN